MPGQEIKGRSKRANYRHGGRTGFKHGKYVKIPTPHADINKYVTQRGKVEGPEGEGSYWRRKDSTMEVPAEKKSWITKKTGEVPAEKKSWITKKKKEPTYITKKKSWITKKD